MSDALSAFQWQTQADAAALLDRAVATALARSPAAARLADRLLRETGTRFVDWIDHLVVSEGELAEWRATGFVDQGGALRHSGGLFPAVIAGINRAVALRVESVADCCAALGIDSAIEGDPGPGLRRARLATSDGLTLWAVERLGATAFTPTPCPPARLAKAVRHLERFRCRPRGEDGFARARERIDAAVSDLGRDVACDLFFAAERDYWQRRNAAARVQKARQDALGLGWANHDHHTYRSSRAAFATLIGCLESLGFACRERFYAGREAGWGAQVLEHAATGIVIFADVDLSPDELRGDFAHEPLAERHELGTVGLWCALHGEAFLAAGMHHLEATFAFDQAREQLAACGVATMKPFTDYPHLRQCFTAGERWKVASSRIDALLTAGRITEAQAEQFRRDGAIGSHLEVLERNQGFKGFNQHGVSEIIAATDPRKG